jgi:glucose/arabinose dehydrogenase
MTFLRPLFAFFLFAATADAATLPGFRVETLVRAPGFVSSVVSDPHGTIFFSTTNGWIYRVDGTQATPVVHLPTHSGGNGGLLGMALLDDRTAAVHYTTWDGADAQANVLDDVIARVDLIDGGVTVLHSFVGDINRRANGVSSEHHGGNLTIAPDGSIFVGIGEYGGHIIAQEPEWNGGKIWRIGRDGIATQWSLGMRNPYDLAWDPELQRIVAADNGDEGGDEIHVINEGDNCGWPLTYGSNPPVEGAIAPAYVFPQTVAPTGVVRLDGANPLLRRGYLVGGFVTRALYYFPSMQVPVAEPVAVVDAFPEMVIDVTQTAGGDLLFATASGSGTAIHQLHPPLLGDCNADGVTDYRDVYPLMREIADDDASDRHAMVDAQAGSFAGSWGCDANADGLIDSRDMAALGVLLHGRRRAVR